MANDIGHQAAIGAALLSVLSLIGPLSCRKAELSALAGPEDFRFGYVLSAGPGDVPLRLSIDGHQATLIRQRAVPEAGGEAIGVFRAELLDEDLSRIESVFPDRIKDVEPPAPDTPCSRFKLTSNGRNIELLVPHEPEALAQVSELAAEVDRLTQQLLAKPYRALCLELVVPKSAPVAGRSSRIKVQLRNPGEQPVQVGLQEPGVWIEAAPAPEPVTDPNVTPLPVIWDRISTGAPSRRSVKVKGGASAEVSVPVAFSQPGPMLVQARFEREGELDAEAAEIFGAVMSEPVELDVEGD